LWSKAPALVFAKHCTAEEALSSTLAAGLKQLAANEECARLGSHVEGVHQLRVALRRLRATLALYKALIPVVPRTRLKARLTAQAQALAAAREWDVFLTEILTPVTIEFGDDADLALLDREARRRHKQAYAKARRALESGAFAAMKRELAHLVKQHRIAPARMPLADDHAAEVLDSVHRKLRKRGKHLSKMAAEERHRFRIQVKKMRYACEFFAPLFANGRDSDYHGVLRALQDDLGVLNDLAGARALIASLCAGETPRHKRLARAGEKILGFHHRTERMREAKLEHHWHALKQAQPFWR
jgi:CHAD domain-containing protein